MGKVRETAGYIESGMKKLGIRIADTSLYTMREYSVRPKLTCVIIAGYFPNHACLCTVVAHIRYDDGSILESKFSLCAQLTGEFHKGLVACIVSEYTGVSFSMDGAFEVYAPCCRSTDGLEFFRDILVRIKGSLAPCFTSPVRLWYVPDYSDVALDVQKKDGKFSPIYSKTFNDRVIALLPRNIFSKRLKV